MQQLILIIHILVAVAIVALVLLQQTKSAGMGSAFGGGASGTLLGSQGSTPLLFKLTAVLVAVFFSTSIVLAHMTTTLAHKQRNNGVAFTPGKPAVPSLPVQNNVPSSAPQLKQGGSKQPVSDKPKK